jgi:hypothetical protein
MCLFERWTFLYGNFIAQILACVPVYVVGESTGELARRELASSSTLGEDTGCATALAQFIIQHHTDRCRPLLFPCADQAKVPVPVICS